MSSIHTPDKINDLPLSIVKNIISLATSGFGLVVALAWNELIKQAVEQYLAPLLGEGGSIISLFIYAVTVTTLAVIVSMELAKIQKKLERS